MRLIDADKLETEIEELIRVRYEWISDSRAERRGLDIALCALEDAPTIDAIPVVRCKDCKWFDRISDNSCFGYCHAAEYCFRSKNWDVNIYRTHKEDFYCADGEREEDDETHD